MNLFGVKEQFTIREAGRLKNLAFKQNHIFIQIYIKWI
jgi:hypothetical protein